jgi:hypothetical protein
MTMTAATTPLKLKRPTGIGRQCLCVYSLVFSVFFVKQRVCVYNPESGCKKKDVVTQPSLIG